MSIKFDFLNMSLEYVYAIDMFWGYVEKNAIFLNIFNIAKRQTASSSLTAGIKSVGG
ncbi:hypothetical protein HMPREF0986_04967 [Escherichia coli 4_1_47FAA]|nr:hypothetical protein HMPREF0986_04967 [Escherichia coli 4_1_47FAA]